jgi:hypothetical protein
MQPLTRLKAAGYGGDASAITAVVVTAADAGVLDNGAAGAGLRGCCSRLLLLLLLLLLGAAPA